MTLYIDFRCSFLNYQKFHTLNLIALQMILLQ